MLIKMTHPETGREADVHPDMEQHYMEGGFVRVEEEKELVPSKMLKADVIAALEARGIEVDPKELVDDLRDKLQESLDTPLVDFAAGAENKEE